MSNRSANSSIKGFLYQFQKTLFEILNSNNENNQIVIEGIEDVDVVTQHEEIRIQCKYHEFQESYSASKVEKPIIQMIENWCSENQESNIQYILFCYFPNKETCIETKTVDELKGYINKTTPETLESNKDKIRKFITANDEKCITDFSNRLTIDFGPSYEELESKNIKLLEEYGFDKTLISTLFYPNSINEIAKLSIKKTDEERTITKEQFLKQLRILDKITISKYTKLLKDSKKIFNAKRNELKEKLSSNTRKRYFLFDANDFENFENTMVCFIKEYLDKYLYKRSKLHMNDYAIPTFILCSTFNEFKNICTGLRAKNIKVNNGYDFENWVKEDFFQVAQVDKNTKELIFKVRIMQIDEDNIDDRLVALAENSPEDFFIIDNAKIDDIDWLGTNVEKLNVSGNMKILKYLLRMVGDYE